MGNSNTNNRFSSYYETGDILGRGTFAVVKKCYRKSDKREFAVKIVDKRQLTGKELVLLKDEIKMLQVAEHVYVIKMFDVFDNGVQVKMVLELCNGGNLLDHIYKQPNRCLDESAAARFTAIIARSLKYLHSHCIVHRDLKPENILFTSDGVLKLTDFGLAHYMKVTQDLHYMHTCCGTPHYVAPEVLTSNGMGSGQYDHYGYEVDYWSLGVIVYIMLSGKQPFNSKSINAMYQLIISGTYQFDSPAWDNVSSNAKDLIKHLMCVDIHKRMTYDGLIEHAWITKYVDENDLIKEEAKYLEKLQQTISGKANINDSNNDSNNNSTVSSINNSHIKQNNNNNDNNNGNDNKNNNSLDEDKKSDFVSANNNDQNEKIDYSINDNFSPYNGNNNNNNNKNNKNNFDNNNHHHGHTNHFNNPHAMTQSF